MRAACRRLAEAATEAGARRGDPYSWMNGREPSSTVTGLLAGRSIAIKENISFRRAPTTCSSQILDGYKPPYNATCVDLLLGAGAHITGLTKMDEFGMGSETTHLPPGYGPVVNPSGPETDTIARSAGGSSGGSAAAVAEGSCWAALGTDTGGSVRLPASYCGIVGLKPSYGMISRHGVVAYADSLDCVGVMASDVQSVQDVFNVLSVPDQRDMTCASSSSRSIANTSTRSVLEMLQAKKPLEGLRIGIPVQTQLPEPHYQVNSRLIEHLESLGATVNTVDLPSFKSALPAYYVLASAEASSNLGRFGGGWYGGVGDKQIDPSYSGEERRRAIRSQGFGKEVKKRILAGTYALSADAFNNTYLKALQLRQSLRREFSLQFRMAHPLSERSEPPRRADGVDVLLHPTALGEAPILGAVKPDGESEYLQDRLTVPASLAGLPALSVPSGRGRSGWPLGVSLVGQWGSEELLFHIAKQMRSQLCE